MIEIWPVYNWIIEPNNWIQTLAFKWVVSYFTLFFRRLWVWKCLLGCPRDSKMSEKKLSFQEQNLRDFLLSYITSLYPFYKCIKYWLAWFWQYNVVEKDFYKLQSPNPDIGVIRVSGVFPSISKCGTKLAFVDNEFKAVWVADDKGLHMVYKVYSPSNYDFDVQIYR